MREFKIVIIDILRNSYKSIQHKDNSHIIPNIGISYLKEERGKMQNKKIMTILQFCDFYGQQY